MPLNLPNHVWDFFDARHIGMRTLEHFRISGGRRKFGTDEISSINFPYIHEGKIVGWKYRSAVGKQWTQAASKQATLYHADAIDPSKPLYHVEGESDVLAMFESGYENTVSNRDGSQGFNSLDAHKDILAKVKLHVLCGDMDEAGLKWRAELARRFGKQKCKFVEWPDGCKDASDVLQKYDDRTEAIRRCVEAARPFPVRGILELPNIDELLDAQPPPTMGTGTAASDAILHLPTDGRLIVLTGRYEQGKSSWTKFVMAHTARYHGRKWLAFAGEDDPDTFWRDMIRAYVGKAQRDMLPQDRLNAIALRTCVRLLEIGEDDLAPTFSSVMERAADSVLAHGTTDVLIDPWNEIEYERGGASVTDYIGKCLQEAKRFAKDHGCNMWFNAHPPKLKTEERDVAMTGYDIADSAHWANKADLGLAVRRLRDTDQTELSIWKAKRGRWGRSGRKCRLEFDQATGRYLDPVHDDTPPEPPPRWEENE